MNEAEAAVIRTIYARFAAGDGLRTIALALNTGKQLSPKAQHGRPDEQCLQQAADIRLVLNELFDNISRVLKDDEELRGAVNRLQGTA